MIKLEKLSRQECLRYLGGKNLSVTPQIENLLDICEKKIFETASVKYLYKEIPVDSPVLHHGNDIEEHLKGCEKAVVMCATLGPGIDRLIRVSQITDMSEAVVIDSLASVAIEQVCNQVDMIVSSLYPGEYLTFRFSCGYGDYPIDLQGEFLRILDAPRKIGLCTNKSSLLTPTKSVTAVMGISKNPIEKRKRGCAVCNMRENCKFRKAGLRCDI